MKGKDFTYALKNKIYTYFILIIAFTLFFSGIIRNDVNPKKYKNLAREKKFQMVGRVVTNNLFTIGTCVLINKKFVITSATSLLGYDYVRDSIYEFGIKKIVYKGINPRIIGRDSIKILMTEVVYKIKNIVVHQNFLNEKTFGCCDIAIIELDDSITDIKPIPINKEYNELNSNIVGVGYGNCYKPKKLDEVINRNIKIAGQNSIDSIGGFKYLEHSTILYGDFDCDKRSNYNSLGSSKPLPLEFYFDYNVRGAGIFRSQNDRLELIGISTYGNNNPSNTSFCGQEFVCTRISPFVSWIDSLIN